MKKPEKNKSYKRNKSKYPALNPSLNTRIRREYNDLDYIDKLNPEEKAWMNKFMAEFLNADIILDENKKLDPEQNIHKDPKYKKLNYDSNNFRNRDQYGLIKAKVANTKLINYENAINIVEEHLSRDVNPSNMENAYLDFIEYKELEDFIKQYQTFMKTYNEESG